MCVNILNEILFNIFCLYLNCIKHLVILLCVFVIFILVISLFRFGYFTTSTQIKNIKKKKRLLFPEQLAEIK